MNIIIPEPLTGGSRTSVFLNRLREALHVIKAAPAPNTLLMQTTRGTMHLGKARGGTAAQDVFRGEYSISTQYPKGAMVKISSGPASGLWYCTQAIEMEGTPPQAIPESWPQYGVYWAQLSKLDLNYWT